MTQEHDAQLVVRLPAELLARIDSYAERMRKEAPGSAPKRAEVVRVLLTKALDSADRVRNRNGAGR